MKNLKIILTSFVFGTMTVLLLNSCSDNSDDSVDGSSEITGIYKYIYDRPSEDEPIDYSAPLDSLTTIGFSGISYLIRGNDLASAKKITVNGTEVDFNTTLVTNSQIFVLLPTGIPYSDDTTPNSLIVTTDYGNTSSYFYIGQPFPTITEQPLALIEGETVEIKGSDFARLQEVRFGLIESGVDNTIAGEIVSFDEETITVKVPDGIPSTGNIFVTTLGGTTIAPSVYGADYPLFEESEMFNDWSWAATHEPSTEQARDGMYSEKIVFNGWDALYANLSNDPFNNPVVLGEYSYLKISLYADINTTVRIFMDWDADSKSDINIAEGEWTDFLIPVEDLSGWGLTASHGDFVIQEFTGTASTIYIDNMGFVK